METKVRESGHYFGKIYAGLISKMSEFPNDDPSPNLRACIKPPNFGPNFVRAEMLARQHSLSSDILIALQELAVMQYSIDFQNVPGLKELLKQFQITPLELVRLFELIKVEKVYPCFSFSKATEVEGGISSNWDNLYSSIEEEIAKWFEKWYKKERGEENE
jgi:hypothetical protein